MKAALIILISALPASATTYFVDNAGNDGNSGTSSGSPWKTVSKVNATTLSPGDSVLFKCGGSWVETLTNSQSGSVGNVITVSTYSTGAAPLLQGVEMKNQSFITLNGLMVAGNPITGTDYGGINANGGGNLNVLNCIAASNACVGIGLFSASILMVSNCLVYSNSNEGIRIRQLSANPQSNFVVTACVVTNNHAIGVEVTASIGIHYANFILTNNALAFNASGYYATYLDGGTIAGNTVQWNDAPSGDSGGLELEAVTSQLIEHNDVGFNGRQNINLFGSSSVGNSDFNIIRYNYVHDSTNSGSGYGINFNPFTLNACNSNQFYYNLIVRNNIGLEGNNGNQTLWNNNFYNNTVYGGNYGANLSASGITNVGLNIVNCLFDENSILAIAANTATTLVHSNNCYYRTASGNRVQFHGSLYNAGNLTTFEPTCVPSNPQLLGLVPGPGSPLRNAGANLGLLVDYNGTTIVPPPDIGAYESSSLSPPHNLRVVNLNVGTLIQLQ